MTMTDSATKQRRRVNLSTTRPMLSRKILGLVERHFREPVLLQLYVGLTEHAAAIDARLRDKDFWVERHIRQDNRPGQIVREHWLERGDACHLLCAELHCLAFGDYAVAPFPGKGLFWKVQVRDGLISFQGYVFGEEGVMSGFEDSARHVEFDD